MKCWACLTKAIDLTNCFINECQWHCFECLIALSTVSDSTVWNQTDYTIQIIKFSEKS